MRNLQYLQGCEWVFVICVTLYSVSMPKKVPSPHSKHDFRGEAEGE